MYKAVLGLGLWILGSVLLPPTLEAKPVKEWQTTAEATNYKETSRYADTVAYAQRLADASELVDLQFFGTTPEGRKMAVLIASKDQAFTPEAARATGKEILWIQAGIHSGEIEGKDAGLALLRDMVITKEYQALLDHAIVIFIPVFSVDGHERFTPYNRINQNGPAQTGWRTTAQNFNLNRDFLKADSPEMQAWLTLFHAWLPDLVVDSHNTNGADYQYDLTYGLELSERIDPGLVAWQQKAFVETIFPAVTQRGHKLAPYVVLRDEYNLSKGFNYYFSSPRFSTGYGAVQNRPTILVETHMLKDYKNRVTATYDLLLELVRYVNQTPGTLRQAVMAADQKTIALGQKFDPARKFLLDLKLTEKNIPFKFLGVAYTRELSPISGFWWVKYDATKPQTFTIPYYNEVVVSKTLTPPLAYIIPVQWTEVIDRLKFHGIRFQTLTESMTIPVDTYRFEQVSWQPKPFEGHHQIKDLKIIPVERTMTYLPGSVLVPLDQRGAQVAIHLLEPDSPDSLLRWGFFDAIFEPKEYAEAYVMEKMARQMLAADPKLKTEFETKLDQDPAFRQSADDRLEFFYQRTPFYDDRLNIYPVGRLQQMP